MEQISVHAFSILLIIHRVAGILELVRGNSGDALDSRTTDNFGNADQHTKHVFRLGEGTGVPGGNPRNTEKKCKFPIPEV